MAFSRNERPTLSDSEFKLLSELQHLQHTPKQLVIISDAGRDHDDEVALIVAAGLIKLGLLTIKCIVANLKPATERARLIDGILKTLQITNIPIGVGLSVDENSTPQSYEFDASYIAEEKNYPDGQELLKKSFEEVADHSLTLLLISGLTDASLFIEKNSGLAKQKLERVVIMGGLESENSQLKHDASNHWIPDESYNHKVDMPSASSLYKLLQELGIPLLVVSRFCAMACAIGPKFYNRLAQEPSPIGKRLWSKQSDAIHHLWKRVFLNANDPKREGLPPYCNKDWFLKTFTNYSENLKHFTEQDDIWPYVIKLNAYDPIALLAATLPDLFNSVNEEISGVTHAVIGVDHSNVGVTNPDKVRSVLSGCAIWGLSAAHSQQLTLIQTEEKARAGFSIFDSKTLIKTNIPLQVDNNITTQKKP